MSANWSVKCFKVLQIVSDDPFTKCTLVYTPSASKNKILSCDINLIPRGKSNAILLSANCWKDFSKVNILSFTDKFSDITFTLFTADFSSSESMGLSK